MALDQVEVLLKVVAVLERLNIPYLVGGSYASSVHGVVRATNDIDLLAAIKPEQAKEFADSLQDEFYADEQAIMRAVRARQHFNIIHLDSMFKIDFFIAKPIAFHEKQMERRRLEPVGRDARQSVYVTTPEDTILAKLVWYRKGNEISDQQWRDILGVIRVQDDKLDLEYLHRWAEELEVADLLARAME
jgi:hypothetical protein